MGSISVRRLTNKIFPVMENIKRDVLIFYRNSFVVCFLIGVFTPLELQAKANQPQPFYATYQVSAKGIPFKSVAHQTLKQGNNGDFHLEMKISNLFKKLQENSVFTAPVSQNSCDFTSKSYRHVRKGIGKNKKYNIHFDWAAADKNKPSGKATYEYKKGKSEVSIAQGVVDRLTEQLAIQCMVAKGETQFSIQILDKDKVKEHKFEVVGKETIETKNAAFETVKVARVRENSSRKTTFWLATKYNHTLVKMVQEKDGGDRFQLDLKTLEGDGWKLEDPDDVVEDNQWDGTEEP